ncbi:MAG TPA: YtxH domain-containing protein, partial [Nitrospirae bacterium]|nr:YtxH domain-containing protein [Nitrospirota bacterium]
MGNGNKDRDISNYVLLGAFLGSLVGTTITLLALSESREEKKEQIRTLQKELLGPVKEKIAEMVDYVGSTFKTALEEAS